jgi:hypothetical protein
MIFSDPPYNVEMKSISGKGKAKHTDFAMAAGEMSRDQFTEFLAAVFALMAAYSVDGSIHYQCIDWRHGLEMQQAGERAYSELKNLIVWNKGWRSCSSRVDRQRISGPIMAANLSLLPSRNGWGRSA